MLFLDASIVDPSSTLSILWWAVTGLIGIVGTLTYTVYSNYKERVKALEETLKEKEKEIKEYIEYIKDVNIDTIKTLNELGGFIRTLTDNSERNNSDMKSDIKEIKELVRK